MSSVLHSIKSCQVDCARLRQHKRPTSTTSVQAQDYTKKSVTTLLFDHTSVILLDMTVAWSGLCKNKTKRNIPRSTEWRMHTCICPGQGFVRKPKSWRRDAKLTRSEICVVPLTHGAPTLQRYGKQLMTPTHGPGLSNPASTLEVLSSPPCIHSVFHAT